MGVFIGLVIGLLVAFIVVWLFNRMPLPFRTQETSAPIAENGASPSTLPLPGKPGDKPREKQKLEFYDILEGKSPPSTVPPVIKTPTDESADDLLSKTAPEAKPADVFFLQVGAFKDTEDVDKLKAKLALQGFDADVQEITIAGKGVMQRVRVGPFRNLAEMNRARMALVQGGIQTTVIKQAAAE